MREIFARQGDELQVGLEGRSFLFLGFPDAPAQRDGMSFKGKETKENKSYFTFKALKLGDYDLDFLQQDNSTGRSVRETVRVHVVPEAEFAAAIAGGGPQGAGLAPAVPARARRASKARRETWLTMPTRKGSRASGPARLPWRSSSRDMWMATGT